MTDPRPLQAAAARVAALHLQRRRRILWMTSERTTPRGFPGDTRRACYVFIDGIEWRVEPAGNGYDRYWIVLRDRAVVAKANQQAACKHTVERILVDEMEG